MKNIDLMTMLQKYSLEAEVYVCETGDGEGKEIQRMDIEDYADDTQRVITIRASK